MLDADYAGSWVQAGGILEWTGSSPYGDAATFPLTTYYYWVKGCNVGVCTDFSAGDDGFRADSVPAAPAGITASDALYPGHVLVQWDSDIVAVSYDVYRDIDASGTTKVLVSSPTGNSYFDASVTDLTVYYYWVKSCSAIDCSALSASDSGYADATALPTFEEVAFDHPNYGEIEALWIAGFTAGCTTDPLNFCPSSILNRADAAVFILRGQFGKTYSSAA